jgi:hypothetical protein
VGYIFGSAPAFVVVVLAPDGAFGGDSAVFGFDVGVEGRVGEVGFVAGTTGELSPFLVASGFPSFFLFDFGGFRVLGVVLDVEVVDHVHGLHDSVVNHFRFAFVVLLGD